MSLTENDTLIDSKVIKIHPIEKGAKRLDIPVSIVKGAKNNKIVKYQLLRDVLNDIVNPKNKSLVDFTNDLKKAITKNRAAYDKLKNNKCSGFIIGKFNPPRKDENCEVYVPLLAFDIDAIEDEFYMSLALEDCKRCPNIFLAFPSPSRKGLRIFIWCKSTPETHKNVYEQTCQMLSESLNIKTDKAIRADLKAEGLDTKEINKRLKSVEHIDTGTKNVSRIWFYTHLLKEEVYLNLGSNVFSTDTDTLKRPERPLSLLPQNHTSENVKLDDDEKIRLCVKMAKQRNILAGRNNELYSLACLMVEHGVSQSALKNYCLKLDELDFTEEEINKTVKSAFSRATANKFSEQQLINWRAKVEGKSEKKGNSEIKKESKKTETNNDGLLVDYEELDLSDIESLKEHFEDKNLSAFLKIKPYVLTKYEFRQNIISNDIEYRLKGSNDSWEELNEHDIECEVLNFNMKSAVDKPLMTILRSSLYVPRFNPISYYFSNLPKWNENDADHITNLANYVLAKDQQWFNYQFKKMLVRSVACALNYTPFNKQCFTFLGAQNDGKSTFIRFLCPPSLKNYYKEDIDITNKDGTIALTQNMFINFEELDALNKKELNKIKAMFTVDKIKVRPPYGRRALNFPRVCNFFASSNREEILTDETGNVRWLVFEIKGINHDNGGENGYNKKINIDLVWSQAYQLLLSGYKFNLSREDIAKSETNNKSYQQTTVEMEWIQKIYSPGVTNGPNSTFLMAADIMREISIQSKNARITINNVGKALRFLNFTKSQYRYGEEKNPRRGYWVKSNIEKIEEKIDF